VPTITSRQNPLVRTFRALADAPDPQGARLLLDGAHLVAEALGAGAPFEAVAVSASRLERGTPEAAVTEALDRIGVPVVRVSESVLRAASPVRSPSGIVAIVGHAVSTPVQVCAGNAAFVAAAVDVQDPGNLGALLRSAEAAGVTGVLVCGASASPFSWKAVRGSMGSVLRLPVAQMPSATGAIARMKEAGMRVVGAAPRGGRPPDDVTWTGAVGLLLGGEGGGLTDELLAACDEQVTIPMAPPVESLNVSAAGAVLFYAARRQRR
jgi:TrmH family RNA methyltransferase